MKQNNIFSYNFLVTVTSSIISEPKHNHVVSSLVTIAAAYGCKLEPSWSFKRTNYSLEQILCNCLKP